MKSKVLLEPHYLPCLEYFACLSQFGTIQLDIHAPFVRQTYRNRCRVLTANKVDVLTVPVRAARNKSPLRDVRVDYGQAWIRRHWGCLQSAYGKSPFFEHYSPEFEKAYRKKPTFLFELNYELLTLCLRFLGLEKDITYTLSDTFSVLPVFDARSMINQQKTADSFTFYAISPYHQTFGNDFVPNLSIIDLLFNKGPEARLVLSQSAGILHVSK